MALTRADKDFITSTVKLAVQEAVKPVADQGAKHEQTLFGPTGNNGLMGDVKKLKDWRHFIDKERMKVLGMAMGGSAVATTAINFLFK